MPSIVAFDIAVDEPINPYPARLHGAACAVLEQPDIDHHAQHKPFTVWPLQATTGGARWRLGWLPDQRPAVRHSPALRFGSAHCPIRDHAVTDVSFAQLAASGSASRARLRMISPTYFSRNGRDHPLPDPSLIIDSATRRWNTHAPEHLHIPDDEHRALRSAAVLADLDGRTERGPVSARMDQIGFVGTITVALPRAAATATRHLFAALMQFVEIAGIGAQTTHGFGAVELLELDQR